MQTDDVKLRPLRWVTSVFPISYQRAADLARRGVLPTVRLGRQVFVDPKQIEQFVKTGGRALPGGWRQEARS